MTGSLEVVLIVSYSNGNFEGTDMEGTDTEGRRMPTEIVTQWQATYSELDDASLLNSHHFGHNSNARITVLKSKFSVSVVRIENN